MPNTHSTLTSLFTDIANAIRAKKGTSADIVADNFPSEIASIPTGGITPTGNINITDTNVTDVTNYATATIVDADLVASNIKKNVNILGVVGSFEGGGSLPSSISKIDGGSFTVASDTATDYMWITHNLAEAPKGCMVWTDDNAQESYNRYTFVQGGTATDTTIMYAFRNNSGALSYQSNATFNTTDTQFRVNRNVISYKAGCTYKWLVWA